jgi:phage replication-related protein YjqB (UPF0714/DUF867 family)
MLFLRPRRERYRSFAELQKREREGVDFIRRIVPRGSRVAIVAPHGGAIEAGTTEIALGVAGSELSLYTLDGTKPRGNDILHVRSGLFDDPECLEIVRRAETVVSIHGAAGKTPMVHVGGLDEPLKRAIIDALCGEGIRADLDETDHSGLGQSNICNRGASGRGVQLEISHALRLAMFEGLLREERAYTTPIFRKFVATLRTLLIPQNSGPTIA